MPEELRVIRAILAKFVGDCSVWAFGSRVRGSAKPASDLDLAIVCAKPIDSLLMANLREAFSESDLPMKVDLVDYALAQPSFRKLIENEKVVIQAIDSSR